MTPTTTTRPTPQQQGTADPAAADAPRAAAPALLDWERRWASTSASRAADGASAAATAAPDVMPFTEDDCLPLATDEERRGILAAALPSLLLATLGWAGLILALVLGGWIGATTK